MVQVVSLPATSASEYASALLRMMRACSTSAAIQQGPLRKNRRAAGVLDGRAADESPGQCRSDPEVPVVKAVDVATVSSDGVPDFNGGYMLAIGHLGWKYLRRSSSKGPFCHVPLDVAEVPPGSVHTMPISRDRRRQCGGFCSIPGRSGRPRPAGKDVAAPSKLKDVCVADATPPHGLSTARISSAGISLNQPVDERARVIGAAIVDQNDFKPGEGVATFADRLRQEVSVSCGRNDHGHRGRGPQSHPPRVKADCTWHTGIRPQLETVRAAC